MAGGNNTMSEVQRLLAMMSEVQQLLGAAWRPSSLDGFEGWANKETWAVFLWLEEDREWMHRAITAAAGAGETPARVVKTLVDDLVDAWWCEMPLMFQVLIEVALERVDWDAVGEAFL